MPGRERQSDELRRDAASLNAVGDVAAARDWQRENPWPTDLGHFAREVAPRLAHVPVRALVEATGLSTAYCRRVRDGQVVPHPMWWGRVERLTRADDLG